MFFNTDFDSTYFCSRSCPFRVLLHTPALFCPFERFTSCSRYFVCPLLSLSSFGSEIPTQIPLVFCRLFVRTSSLSLSAPKTFYETTTTKKKRRKHRRRRRLCALSRASDKETKKAQQQHQRRRDSFVVSNSRICALRPRHHHHHRKSTENHG